MIVEPQRRRAYTIFAQSMDRSGYARGTLAPRAGMTADVPALDPRPLLSMARHGHGAASRRIGARRLDHSAHGSIRDGSRRHGARRSPPRVAASHGADAHGPCVDMQAMSPIVGARRSRRGLAQQRSTRADLRRSAHASAAPSIAREPARDDRAASDGPHGALRVVVRRPEVLRMRRRCASRTASGCASCW